MIQHPDSIEFPNNPTLLTIILQIDSVTQTHILEQAVSEVS